MLAVVLAAIGVSKEYPGGVRALDRVDLEVAAGETVALVGASGSGKTTLLRMFNRTCEPSSGQVCVGGGDVAALDPIALRRATGYVPQEGGLLPHWTVERNVGLVPGLLGWDAPRIRGRTEELLELVGLPRDSYGRRYPSELSGGQRQRVAFARALAADPDVVLLDEPFGALDALTRVDLQDEFLALARRLHKTMLLVTHDVAEAFRLAGRVAVMNDGRIVREGTPGELLESPNDDYVEGLLAKGLGDRGRKSGP
jgi:osmoprotectant transport system ATP-binding protein